MMMMMLTCFWQDSSRSFQKPPISLLPSTAFFSTRTRPHLVTFFAIVSGYFSGRRFPLTQPQHSQSQLFFIRTCLLSWNSQIVLKCWHINFRPGELPRMKYSVLLDYLQSLTGFYKLWTATVFITSFRP